ncbi:MAG: alpha-1,2-fucosyltransferase [Candidatus Nomurabacteria bacterium]|nr:alpha-1,2-fucosyltransferase [Candidatus Nomurabacteria bacterium]
MIIIRIQGGLGNQMFQYALGRALSIKNNVPLGLDLTFLLDRTPIPNFTFREYQLDSFNIQATIVEQKDIPFLYRKYNLGFFMRYIDYIRRKLLSTPGKEKKNYYFDPEIMKLGPNAYLEGWWQNPEYFSDILDIIRKDFTLKNEPIEKIKNLLKEIKENNSLCIHIRRGDYVGNIHHEIVGKDYYSKCIEYIKERTKIDKIYIFSDDIKWCEENLKFEFLVMFVGDEYSGEKDEGHMILMSACKNFIIPNSTFSWWAAYLSPYKDKIVICPKEWIRDENINSWDLIPKEWIQI